MDPVVGKDRAWWDQWFPVWAQLKYVEISRCLVPDEDSSINQIEFTSEETYSAVVYAT